MKVGFSKLWGSILLGLGCVSLVLMLLAGTLLVGPLISGGVAVLAGSMMLSRTYFEIGGGVLIVRAMVGPATRRYPYQSIRDFRFEGNKLYLGPQKIGIAKSQADSGDWARFVEYLKSESAKAA
jgi:hypothetical protein